MLKTDWLSTKNGWIVCDKGVSHGGVHSHPSDHLFLRHRRVLSHHRGCDALHVVLCLDVLRIPIEMSSLFWNVFFFHWDVDRTSTLPLRDDDLLLKKKPIRFQIKRYLLEKRRMALYLLWSRCICEIMLWRHNMVLKAVVNCWKCWRVSSTLGTPMKPIPPRPQSSRRSTPVRTLC